MIHLHYYKSKMPNQQEEVAILVVPFPAQGHLNQLLHLSFRLANTGLHVHFAGTTYHNHQAKRRIHGWDSLSSKNIHFHDFQIPSFVSPPPNPNPKNNFPSHLQPLFDASLQLRQPVSKLLKKLSLESRKVIVINDSLMGYVVQEASSIPNVESYTFHSVSAFTTLLFVSDSIINEKSNQIYNKPLLFPKQIPSLEACFTPEFSKFVASQYQYKKFSNGVIYNTCRVIEGDYFDRLNMLQEKIWGPKTNWALGPFHPMISFSDDDVMNLSKERHYVLKWLDNVQENNSVVYISFGTTTSLLLEQINEIALGLKQSNQKFIWVLRDADEGEVPIGGRTRRPELPEGYEESVKKQGLIVREWAPQLEILGHRSTGGFVSHCGWNSCMESISMGVPIGAWPMHSDQPRNTALVTEILRVGLVVRKWEERENIIKAISIETAIRRLMDSDEGDKIRKRAVELGGVVKEATAEGGASSLDFCSFIAQITR